MTPAAPIIHISSTPKKAVPVDLLGTTYSIKPPKSSLLLAISNHSAKAGKEQDAEGLIRDFDNILKLMFGKNFQVIKERLGDPTDELDLDHIFEAVEAVTEDKADNPTS